MPTLRGWALMGSGLALIALWLVFGDEELLLSGVLFVAAVTAGMAYVRTHPVQLLAERSLSPAAVHDGDSVTVVVSVTNSARRSTVNLRIVDEASGLGSAVFEIARLARREVATCRYRVTCRPRGIYPVGPVRANATDALGLAEVATTAGPVDRLVVYPSVEALAGFPPSRGQNPSQSAALPDHSRRGGEDFYTLRSYQQGDDLRRVHWPWSAKIDELMIRQFEMPWQSTALVLLDTRPDTYESPDAFEKSVSGAASILTHLVRSGFEAELWAGGPGILAASNYPAAMERLALVSHDPHIDFAAAAGRLETTGGGGALVLVTGSPDRSLLALQKRFSADYPISILMGTSSTTPQTLPELHRLGVMTVMVAPSGMWSDSWSSSMRKSWGAISVG